MELLTSLRIDWSNVRNEGSVFERLISKICFSNTVNCLRRISTGKINIIMFTMALTKRSESPSTEIKDFSEIEFETELDARFRCPICNNPLKNPVQTQCGHRMCDGCYQRLLRNSNPQCPLDQESLSSGVFKDVCCRREILNLICYCLNRKHGCQWKKELSYLEEHLPKCEYREVFCNNEGCTEKIPLKKLTQHMRESCRFKLSACQYCQQHVPERELEAHFENCKKFPMICQYCGMANIPRDQMEDHIINQCEEAEKPCKFKSVGCSFVGKQEIMNDHYETQKDEHLKLTVQVMESQKQQEKEVKQRMEKIEKENEKLQQNLSVHRETLAATTQDLRAYQGRLSKVEKTVGEHRKEIAEMRERAEGTASSKASKPSEVYLQLDELRSALADHEEKLGAFERELARGSFAAPGPRSSSSSLTLDRRLDRNEHQLALHDIQLAEHDLKIQMLEATSYNGTYIWKIDEFSRRNHEGIIGKTPSIYSPPFYVGRYGYKVCARVYPNGDGMGKGSHLSLFFVIMKGEYDALLPWPFRQKVTFKLLDQDRQQDVTDTFRPDPNSSSFKRPTSNMNIASGCPLFVSQQVLQSRSYVKDDTMFIKILVETAGLPPLGF